MKENYSEYRHMYRGIQKSALNPDDLKRIKTQEYFYSGNKKALLMLHGFTSSPAVFRHLIPKLKYYDAIFCPALPGHTGSLEELAAATAHDWIAASEQICESLLTQFKQVDVLGLSLGGLLACHLSKKYTLHHLYLLAPALALHMHVNLALKFAKFLELTGFKTIRASAGDIWTPHETEISYRRIPITTIKEILTFIHTFELVMPKIPVDLFLGTYDHVVNSSEVAERFASCAQLNTHWLTNSAHILPIETSMYTICECINYHSENDLLY